MNIIERVIRYVVRIALDEQRKHATEVRYGVVNFDTDAILRSVSRYQRRRGGAA